jgi:hypothetical protein
MVSAVHQFERMMWLEEQRTAAAATKAATEQDFAERQARIDAASQLRRACGPPREREVKHRASEIPGVVYKTRDNALVEAKAARARVMEPEPMSQNWADSFAELMGELVAERENVLRAETAKLRDELGTLRKKVSALQKKLSVVEGIARGDVKMLPASRNKDDAA